MTSRGIIGRAALASLLALACGCAQIVTSSVVEIMPRSEAPPLVLGPPGAEVTARGVAVQWMQDGDRLALQVDESRACASLRHVPVVRVERIHRKTARGAMWWEYGLGAAALAGGLVGLIRPESFSQATVQTDGGVVRDTATGYRIGGIFTGLGVILLTAAVVDTVRTRDEVVYTDAYRREQGGAVECREPLVPLRGRTVELLVDEWSSTEPTDDEGAVRFLLPTVDELPEEARAAVERYEAWAERTAQAEEAARVAEEEARVEAEADAAEAAKKGRTRKKGKAPEPEPAAESEPASQPAAPELEPPPEPFVVRGVLRVDRNRAVAVDFVVPYELEAAAGHEGRVEIEPAPAVTPPPRPRGSEGDGAEPTREALELQGE